MSHQPPQGHLRTKKTERESLSEEEEEEEEEGEEEGLREEEEIVLGCLCPINPTGSPQDRRGKENLSLSEEVEEEEEEGPLEEELVLGY